MILLGSDPECFVADKEGNIVSGIDMIPGTKEKPHPIDDKGHMIQVDNIAWEYNIPPCSTREDFIYSIHFVKKHLLDIANKKGLTLSPLASSEVDEKHLQHPKAKEFGCDPDYNVYLKDINPKPDSNTNLRCCGGHVSISWDNPDLESVELMVQLFDIFLTAPAIIYDSDKRRRELYGNPGSFRVKEWGVECRALSNFWIMSEELTGWVFDQAYKIASIVSTDIKHAESIVKKYSEEALRIIKDSDIPAAQEMLEELNEINN